jgi:hypothetical protein
MADDASVMKDAGMNIRCISLKEEKIMTDAVPRIGERRPASAQDSPHPDKFTRQSNLSRIP